MIFKSPAYPIPPSFKNKNLELGSTQKYLTYLKDKGAKTVMTTAGTSQFNLLSIEEIREFNKVISTFEGNKILGLPSLSNLHLKNEIKLLNAQNLSNAYILILFPERYYNDEQIILFFKEICNYSDYPILVHGNILKKGFGGNYEYSKPLLESLKNINGFMGMKEEASTLMHSIKNIPDKLEVIVAGGSMRRFWSLEPHGATTFLSGVGSFNPEYEEQFYTDYHNNPLNAKNIMNKIETPLFNTFMEIGWHASMREALHQMGFMLDNRDPFIILPPSKKKLITQALNKIL
jgi:dihydrodipicolinate synthase/N-acetylneuraminate lyase